MEKFNQLTGVAAPLDMINVDTDQIIPKLHLRTIKRTGLGKVVFEELRFDTDGVEKPEFVLNQEPYRNARILIAGDNFGCGSSREHAPWALLDFGIRCIISTSFADIFYNNCFKNGVLPIRCDESQIAELFQRVATHTGYKLTVDLEQCSVTDEHGLAFSFSIDDSRRHSLLNALDDIAMTLQHADKIEAYESVHGVGGTK